jgi:hypothetical protein
MARKVLEVLGLDHRSVYDFDLGFCIYNLSVSPVLIYRIL